MSGYPKDLWEMEEEARNLDEQRDFYKAPVSKYEPKRSQESINKDVYELLHGKGTWNVKPSAATESEE